MQIQMKAALKQSLQCDYLIKSTRNP